MMICIPNQHANWIVAMNFIKTALATGSNNRKIAQFAEVDQPILEVKVEAEEAEEEDHMHFDKQRVILTCN